MNLMDSLTRGLPGLDFGDGASIERGVEDSLSQSLVAQSRLGAIGSQSLTSFGLPLPAHYGKFLNVYSEDVWVYACVWIISTNAAGVPISVVDNRGEEGSHRVEVPALEFPNPLMSFSDLMELTVTGLELVGNAYWEVVGDEIYWIRPDLMRVVPDGRKFIKEYVMELNGKKQYFPVEDIVHFRYPNPKNQFYGQATLAAARLSIDSDYDSRRLFRKFYENAAIPAGVLQTDMPNIGEGAIEMVREQVKNLYVGLERAYEPMILPAGLKWQDIQIRPHDLAVAELSSISRSEILGAFRVPPILVGLETQNYATAREQKFTFWNNKVIPLLKKIRDTVDLQYLSRIYGREVGLRAQHDFSGVTALQDPWEQLGSFVTDLKKSGVISANEARAVINTFVTSIDLDDFDGGDDIYEPMNLIPVGESPIERNTGSDSSSLRKMLKQLKLQMERGQIKSSQELRGQLKEALSISRQMTGFYQPEGAESGAMTVFTDEYQEVRMERSMKWREKKGKNTTMFTQAGVTVMNRRYSSKYGWSRR